MRLGEIGSDPINWIHPVRPTIADGEQIAVDLFCFQVVLFIRRRQLQQLHSRNRIAGNSLD
jgi:hypothetical protein